MDLFEAIQARDVVMIRRRLSTYVVANPNDKEVISRAFSMIDREKIPVWDSVDYFERKEKKDWNREYLTDAYAYLKTEYYSRSLLLHITELGRHLSPTSSSNSTHGYSNERARQNSDKEARMKELQQELIELESINRRKGFNQQEKRRFEEIRAELERYKSNQRNSNPSSIRELVIELYQIVRRIINGSKRG